MRGNVILLVSYIITGVTIDRFKSLGERANKIVIERMKQEEEWDEFPDEFSCAIMGELMEHPVKLPSGNR